jgi:propanol-preferring alcohol dehydrogenase
LRLSEAHAGDRLGLFGFGASAHLTLQVARHMGCRVAVFTRSEEHGRVARALGAEWVGDAPALDAAIVFAPAGDVVRRALESVRPGGVVAVNAIHMDPPPSFPYRALYGERTLRSVTNFTREDAREFIRLAAEIPLHVEREVFRLEEAGEALARMRTGRLRAAAVLLI